MYLNVFKVLKNPVWSGFLRYGSAHLHDALVSRMGQARVGSFWNPEEASVLCQVLREPFLWVMRPP